MPTPPKPASTRARRNDPKKGFTTLSADGRQGPTPDWPLQPPIMLTARLESLEDRTANLQVEIAGEEDGRKRGRLQRELNRNDLELAALRLQIDQARDAEVELWADLWSSPQAVVWEQSHAHREVAQYVRWKIAAEQGDLKAAPEARQLSDRLGLNPLALIRLQLEIERADEAEERGNKRRTKADDRPRKKGGGGDPRGTLRAV